MLSVPQFLKATGDDEKNKKQSQRGPQAKETAHPAGLKLKLCHIITNVATTSHCTWR